MLDHMATLVLEANQDPKPATIARMLDEAAWVGARITIVTRGIDFDLAMMGGRSVATATRRVLGSMTAADVADLFQTAQREAIAQESIDYLTSVHFEHGQL